MLIGLHLAIALTLAYWLNIWADEGSTLYATQDGFLTAFHNAASEQRQAPLYFWLLSLWRSINQSIFFARAFSVICSAIAIWVFARTAERLFSARTALLATAFFALHPYLFWASLEIRVYSFTILLTIILIRTFFVAFWQEDEKWQSHVRYPKAWFLIVAIVALYTNYYLGFVLVGLFVALLVTRKWREALNYLGLMLVAGLAFLPLAVDLRAELLAKRGGYQDEKYVIEGLRTLWHHVHTFVLPTEILTDNEPSILSVIRLWLMRALVVALAIAAIIKRRSLSQNTLILGAIAGTICLLMLIAYFFVGTQYIAIRHAAMLFVPAVLGLASLLSDIFHETSERVLRPLIAIACVVVAVSFSYSLITLYPNVTKRGDWARVAEFIRQNEGPNEPIVVFTTFDALSLPYYYKGANRILPDERFFDFPAPQEAPGSSESLVLETNFVISEIPPEAERVWLAVNEKCLVTRACVPLQNYIDANYTIEIERDFYLEKLYLLRKKQ